MQFLQILEQTRDEQAQSTLFHNCEDPYQTPTSADSTMFAKALFQSQSQILFIVGGHKIMLAVNSY